jgi:type IV secretory pathway VirB4 component
MNNYIYNLKDIFPIQKSLTFIIGQSGTGKTQFIKLILDYFYQENIYLYCQDLREWEDNTYNININNTNPIENSSEFNKIPKNSIVIIDDYFHPQSQRGNEHFHEIINYKL